MKVFKKLLIVLLFFILIICLYFALVNTESSSTEVTQIPIKPIVPDSVKLKDTSSEEAHSFIQAVTSDEDTNYRVVKVSSKEALNVPYALDDKAGKPIKRVFTGRRINIAITGVDSRLGTGTPHADANHVLSILVDSGAIEIISVPRDTPADAGMPDTSGQNKLTVVRAGKGRNAYLKELARIAGLDKIHYYVEAGFSQVMGILELVGIRDSKSALQVLRSRKGLGGDDYQRCYNQAQFIRQTILKHSGKLNGVFGNLLIRGGLALVETNLTAAAVNQIFSDLKAKGFPRSPSDITVKIRPPMSTSFKVYDFTDIKVFESLSHKIERFNESSPKDSDYKKINDMSRYVENKLRNLLKNASKDTASRPNNVIKALQTYFDQRAWFQVSDTNSRKDIRDQFGAILSRAYDKKKQTQKANQIRDIIKTEKELFSTPVFKQ